ncbi:Fur family transcriptional regulator [Helicobacter sp. WB40]|uniref:Fur family transcriptional regulator n=1 Tax=Helicobacter sp. WB40 TaxID=3004130 RepID=UPI0022EBACF4|nr:Fur family transcriptional regulator [Helicobacter sp. WB40]MDA3966841.1 Fur family transcriptional regulator [Helicobacter sp. WB40]
MFEQILKNGNLKVTPQRMAILQEINTKGHISIDEIYENIKKNHPSMSLATIYKNLTSMQEVKIIDEVKLPNQKPRYELTKKPHIHLVCERCGMIKDIHLEEVIDNLKQSCEKETGYKIRDSSIALLGICKECES